MVRSRRIAAMVAALGVLSFSACSNNDADEGDVVDAMVDAGLTQDQAECVGQEFVAAFDQDQLNDLASAEDPEDFPEGTEDEVETILRDCTGTDGGTDTTDTTEDTSTDGSSDESTTETTEG